ncbi:uncharacterized protein MELLADRAFT_103559 [Melampsora larici-populina 98AG31]|uniref:Uncharacterized protein n=1 Tax=Melampsora larici-populina (strain 98AG31 / pathotype 3-4-7) TaxID=747676 RepID=F4RBQ9_MELLP|nr:uncharacterized protein MELLADRAFT_103559 [Melampsora larici-populina 98AG31]EGG10295.1 hypothetical protein MELLADRAFT_103559 [Melampsora larici-populina 98AG31]
MRCTSQAFQSKLVAVPGTHDIRALKGILSEEAIIYSNGELVNYENFVHMAQQGLYYNWGWNELETFSKNEGGNALLVMCKGDAGRYLLDFVYDRTKQQILKVDLTMNYWCCQRVP